MGAAWMWEACRLTSSGVRLSMPETSATAPATSPSAHECRQSSEVLLKELTYRTASGPSIPALIWCPPEMTEKFKDANHTDLALLMADAVPLRSTVMRYEIASSVPPPPPPPNTCAPSICAHGRTRTAPTGGTAITGIPIARNIRRGNAESYKHAEGECLAWQATLLLQETQAYRSIMPDHAGVIAQRQNVCMALSERYCLRQKRLPASTRVRQLAVTMSGLVMRPWLWRPAACRLARNAAAVTSSPTMLISSGLCLPHPIMPCSKPLADFKQC